MGPRLRFRSKNIKNYGSNNYNWFFGFNYFNLFTWKKSYLTCIILQKNGGYITPFEAEGSYFTYISRIRKDNSNKKALNLWVVSDNLLKGAALNTVQIAETLIKKYIK